MTAEIVLYEPETWNKIEKLMKEFNFDEEGVIKMLLEYYESSREYSQEIREGK
jgi:hypothetical protein